MKGWVNGHNDIWLLLKKCGELGSDENLVIFFIAAYNTLPLFSSSGGSMS